MKRRRKQLATATLIAVFATGLSPADDAGAAEPGEVQELRQEVRQLRADLQTLQAAIAETTELERQRSAGGGEVASGSGATTPPAAPTVTRVDQSRKPSRQRRLRRAPRARSKAPRALAGSSQR